MDLPNVQIDYNGAGPVASVGTVGDPLDFVIETVLSGGGFDADWAARTAAPGVFYKHNNTYRNVAQTQLITNTADMLLSYAQTGGNQWAQWDTTNKLSGGGSFKMNMLAASGYNSNSSANLDFSGVGVRTGAPGFKSVIKHEYYFQFAYYADSVYRDFFYGSASSPAGWGGKIAIFDSADSSFDVGEVVIRRDARPGGFIHGYRLAATSEYFLNQFSSLGDFIQYNFFNNNPGQSAPASTNAMQLRHGPNWNQRNETSPDADIITSGAPRLVSNGWTVIEVYIRQPTSGGFGGTVKVWMAPYGQAPTLVFGGMNGRLPAVGAMDGSNLFPAQIYTGIQFTNYHNEDQPGSGRFWPSQDTFVSYTELIGSDSPINFPGGHAIPANQLGTLTPPNYPASGSTEFF